MQITKNSKIAKTVEVSAADFNGTTVYLLTANDMLRAESNVFTNHMDKVTEEELQKNLALKITGETVHNQITNIVRVFLFNY